jgi:hypothetical protein
MKNGVFSDVTPCGSYKIPRFRGTLRLLHQGDKNRWSRNNASCKHKPTHAAKKHHMAILRSVSRLLVQASVVPSSPMLATMMKEALRSSETSVLTRATRRNAPEEATLHGYYMNVWFIRVVRLHNSLYATGSCPITKFVEWWRSRWPTGQSRFDSVFSSQRPEQAWAKRPPLILSLGTLHCG